MIRLEDIDFEKEKKGMYLMYFNDEFSIYPDLKKDGIHLINHSCSPNCWLYKYQNHTLFLALRDIDTGEELTINYLLPPNKFCSPCPHTCFCGGKNCTKSMHLTEEKYRRWKNFEKQTNKETIPETNIEANKITFLNKYPKSVSKKYIEKIQNLFT